MPADVLAVNTALQSDVEMLKLHRGYMAYLETSPDTAALESAYATLCATPGFAAVAQAFDEALGQDSALEQTYGKYSSFLAANPDARALVEGITNADSRPGEHAGTFDAALSYLRSNPDQALGLLNSPEALKLAPEALRPLLAKLQASPNAQKALVSGFEGLQTGAGREGERVSVVASRRSVARIGEHSVPGPGTNPGEPSRGRRRLAFA